MLIRDLNPKDAHQAALILHQSWRHTFAKYVAPEIVEKFTLDFCETVWKQQLDECRSNLRHIGAFQEQSLLGTISVGPSRELGRSWLEIWSMHVSLGKQRTGIGARLLLEAFKVKDLDHYSATHLFCIKENQQALNFYKKYGGKVVRDVNRRGFNEVEVYWENEKRNPESH